MMNSASNLTGGENQNYVENKSNGFVNDGHERFPNGLHIVSNSYAAKNAVMNKRADSGSDDFSLDKKNLEKKLNAEESIPGGNPVYYVDPFYTSQNAEIHNQTIKESEHTSVNGEANNKKTKSIHHGNSFETANDVSTPLNNNFQHSEEPKPDRASDERHFANGDSTTQTQGGKYQGFERLSLKSSPVISNFSSEKTVSWQECTKPLAISTSKELGQGNKAELSSAPAPEPIPRNGAGVSILTVPSLSSEETGKYLPEQFIKDSRAENTVAAEPTAPNDSPAASTLREDPTSSREVGRCLAAQLAQNPKSQNQELGALAKGAECARETSRQQNVQGSRTQIAEPVTLALKEPFASQDIGEGLDQQPQLLVQAQVPPGVPASSSINVAFPPLIMDRHGAGEETRVTATPEISVPSFEGLEASYLSKEQETGVMDSPVLEVPSLPTSPDGEQIVLIDDARKLNEEPQAEGVPQRGDFRQLRDSWEEKASSAQRQVCIAEAVASSPVLEVPLLPEVADEEEITPLYTDKIQSKSLTDEKLNEAASSHDNGNQEPETASVVHVVTPVEEEPGLADELQIEATNELLYVSPTKEESKQSYLHQHDAKGNKHYERSGEDHPREMNDSFVPDGDNGSADSDQTVLDQPVTRLSSLEEETVDLEHSKEGWVKPKDTKLGQMVAEEYAYTPEGPIDRGSAWDSVDEEVSYHPEDRNSLFVSDTDDTESVMSERTFEPQSCTEEDEPSEWIECHTPEGHTYYYNPQTHQSLWELPSSSSSLEHNGSREGTGKINANNKQNFRNRPLEAKSAEGRSGIYQQSSGPAIGSSVQSSTDDTNEAWGLDSKVPEGGHSRQHTTIAHAPAASSYKEAAVLRRVTETSLAPREVTNLQQMDLSDPNAQNSKGESALHLVSNLCFLQGMEFLLQNGASPHAADHAGRYPLHAAVLGTGSDPPEACCALLLEYGADGGAVDSEGNTALHLAAQSGRAQVVEALLRAGVPRNTLNAAGNSALHLAATNGHLECMQALVLMADSSPPFSARHRTKDWLSKAKSEQAQTQVPQQQRSPSSSPNLPPPPVSARFRPPTSPQSSPNSVHPGRSGRARHRKGNVPLSYSSSSEDPDTGRSSSVSNSDSISYNSEEELEGECLVATPTPHRDDQGKAPWSLTQHLAQSKHQSARPEATENVHQSDHSFIYPPKTATEKIAVEDIPKNPLNSEEQYYYEEYSPHSDQNFSNGQARDPQDAKATQPSNKATSDSSSMSNEEQYPHDFMGESKTGSIRNPSSFRQYENADPRYNGEAFPLQSENTDSTVSNEVFSPISEIIDPRLDKETLLQNSEHENNKSAHTTDLLSSENTEKGLDSQQQSTTPLGQAFEGRADTAVNESEGQDYYYQFYSEDDSAQTTAAASQYEDQNQWRSFNGWTEYFTENGEVYYYHESSGESSWEPPAGWGQEQSSETVGRSSGNSQIEDANSFSDMDQEKVSSLENYNQNEGKGNTLESTFEQNPSDIPSNMTPKASGVDMGNGAVNASDNNSAPPSFSSQHSSSTIEYVSPQEDLMTSPDDFEDPGFPSTLEIDDSMNGGISQPFATLSPLVSPAGVALNKRRGPTESEIGMVVEDQSVGAKDLDLETERSSESEAKSEPHMAIWNRFFENAILVAERKEAALPLSPSSRPADVDLGQVDRQSYQPGMKIPWVKALPEDQYKELVAFARRAQASREKKAEGLYHAVISGKVEDAEALLAQGVPSNLVDDALRTPVHHACKWARWQTGVGMLSTLGDAGAELTARDLAGYTPLHVAASAGTTTCLKYLLESAVDPGASDNSGNTPLHVAVWRGFRDCAALLVEYGADIEATNALGHTPYSNVLVMKQSNKPISKKLDETLAFLEDHIGVKREEVVEELELIFPEMRSKRHLILQANIHEENQGYLQGSTKEVAHATHVGSQKETHVVQSGTIGDSPFSGYSPEVWQSKSSLNKKQGRQYANIEINQPFAVENTSYPPNESSIWGRMRRTVGDLFFVSETQADENPSNGTNNDKPPTDAELATTDFASWASSTPTSLLDPPEDVKRALTALRQNKNSVRFSSPHLLQPPEDVVLAIEKAQLESKRTARLSENGII